jgi:translation elongation factor P/translation initiation factor 5A
VIVASQLREGMALRIDAQIYKVLESEFKAGGGPPRRYTVQRPR